MDYAFVHNFLKLVGRKNSWAKLSHLLIWWFQKWENSQFIWGRNALKLLSKSCQVQTFKVESSKYSYHLKRDDNELILNRSKEAVPVLGTYNLGCFALAWTISSFSSLRHPNEVKLVKNFQNIKGSYG